MSEPIAELSEPIAELLIPKAPKVQMSGDVILLDLEGVVPGWETYTFSLDTVQPGPKQIVLRISHKHVKTESLEVKDTAIASNVEMRVQTETNGNITPQIKLDPEIAPSLEPVSPDERKVPSGNTGDYICCRVIPCHLLVRPNKAHPARFLVRAFDTRFLPLKVAEKGLSPEEYRDRLRKRLRLM